MPASPKPRRRAVSEADKNMRRATMLAAAKHVFAERGFHQTKIADIARAAGVSYGSIYWYFDSKEDLFRALMTSEEDALRDHIEKAIAGAPARSDPVGAFKAAVTATFEFFEDDREAAKLLFRDSLALGGDIEKHLFGIYSRFIREIEGTVVEARKRGAIVDVPPRMVAISVAALISQIALRRINTDDGLKAPVVANYLVDLLINGLRPR